MNICEDCSLYFECDTVNCCDEAYQQGKAEQRTQMLIPYDAKSIEDLIANVRNKTIDEYKNLIIKNLNTLTLGNETQAEYIRIHIEEWAKELKDGAENGEH